MALGDSQKLEVIQTYCLDAANYKTLDSITELSTSRKKAALSTDGLGTAFTGAGTKLKAFGASIKSFAVANPLLDGVAVIGLAIAAYVNGETQ